MTSAGGRFSARRLFAEGLALLGYRRFQARYWELRAKDVVARYSFTDDFPILENLARKIGARSVVDVGCGSGRAFDAYVKASIREITGLEMAPAMVTLAKAKAEALNHAKAAQVTVFQQDIREPLPAGLHCDLLVSSRVLQHIHPRDINATLANLIKLGPRAIYLNEGVGAVWSAYIFRHDYGKLLRPWGYQSGESGKVPSLGYEYSIFHKTP